jgi:hypothetical protein
VIVTSGVSTTTVPGIVPEFGIVVTIVGAVKIAVPVYSRVIVTGCGGAVAIMTVPGTDPEAGIVEIGVGPVKIDVPV